LGFVWSLPPLAMLGPLVPERILAASTREMDKTQEQPFSDMGWGDRDPWGCWDK
jgi:hypothetical protein